MRAQYGQHLDTKTIHLLKEDDVPKGICGCWCNPQGKRGWINEWTKTQEEVTCQRCLRILSYQAKRAGGTQ
jgi:hypothetical protein